MNSLQAARLVAVSMMNVWKVCMSMRDCCMAVFVRMRLGAVPIEVVFVPMMRVMPVPMRVIQWRMRVGVLVAFADMQPDAKGHQRGGEPEDRWRHFGP